MIGAIGASSSWAQLASLRPSSGVAVAAGPIQSASSNVVFAVPPVQPVAAIRRQDPSFTGYGANGQSAATSQSGRTVDRSV
jgi:hypothetical protein